MKTRGGREKECPPRDPIYPRGGGHSTPKRKFSRIPNCYIDAAGLNSYEPWVTISVGDAPA